ISDAWKKDWDDPSTAGRLLNVKAVLDGVIQRIGNSVRVTVKLVRVRDKAVLWAAQFDEQLSDLFAIEDSISEQVARAVLPTLGVEEKRSLTTREIVTTKAYQGYLKGRYLWDRRTRESLEHAITHFEGAIADDPNYASAYLGLADCYFLLSYYGALAPNEGYPKARIAAQKAAEIDETLATAHTSLGCIHFFYDWNLSQAVQEFERAVELNPDDARVHHWYSEY